MAGRGNRNARAHKVMAICKLVTRLDSIPSLRRIAFSYCLEIEQQLCRDLERNFEHMRNALLMANEMANGNIDISGLLKTLPTKTSRNKNDTSCDDVPVCAYPDSE